MKTKVIVNQNVVEFDTTLGRGELEVLGRYPEQVAEVIYNMAMLQTGSRKVPKRDVDNVIVPGEFQDVENLPAPMGAVVQLMSVLAEVDADAATTCFLLLVDMGVFVVDTTARTVTFGEVLPWTQIEFNLRVEVIKGFILQDMHPEFFDVMCRVVDNHVAKRIGSERV